MAKISGIYANGLGEPVAGVCILLTARATSSGVVMTTTASQVTAADGSYAFDLRAGVYVVTASGAYLGVITVSDDSPDGTLNDYLAAYDPAALTPAVVETVQKLVKEAQAAAAEAKTAAAEAAASAASASQGAGGGQTLFVDVFRSSAAMTLASGKSGALAFPFDSTHDVESGALKRSVTSALVFQQRDKSSRITFVVRISGTITGSADALDGWNIKLSLAKDSSNVANATGYLSKVKTDTGNGLDRHSIAVDYFPSVNDDPASVVDLAAYDGQSDFSHGLLVSIQNVSNGTLNITGYELNVVQHTN
ncbi:prophage tail fiber N-terminal domain-containing protein [Enterobacter bugandensis]|uniref:prophage tail fiber N-terminal domain-containing protein n=1 Tax=Enterobacter bugandensis TaxID=881260 RepID=UPI0021CFF3E5|nr:prophage tail fiber N-terminal domain-containing protein [Enterobacter bugandensis]MCU6214424.1 prophage tail fiber N-terminal domain-containing protein [Enterobacter bugandensis]